MAQVGQVSSARSALQVWVEPVSIQVVSPGSRREPRELARKERRSTFPERSNSGCKSLERNTMPREHSTWELAEHIHSSDTSTGGSARTRFQSP